MRKKCRLCDNFFNTTKFGVNRIYCYDCSPYYKKGDNIGRLMSITTLRRAVKRHLVNYKGGKCQYCGYKKSLRALEFHHTDPKEKDFTISDNYNIKNTSLEYLYNEIDKCILVCSNCHAEIHDSSVF